MSIFATVWSLFFVGLFVVIPIFSLFFTAGNFELSKLWGPELSLIASVTVAQSLTSTLISLLMGCPLGLWIGSFRGKSLKGLEFLLAVPFGVPTVVAGIAWIGWLGNSGIFSSLGITLFDGWVYSFKGVILAHVFYNAPWIALLVSQARAFVPEDELEAATNLGAKTVSRFLFIIWPRIRWTLASGAAQVFSLCSMSFALVLILGGGPPVQTLETALYAKVRYGSVDISGAVAVAVVQLMITLIPWAAVLWLNRGQGFQPIHLDRRMRDSADSTGKKFRFLSLVLLCGFFVMPYLISLFSLSGLLSSELLPEIGLALRASLYIALFVSVGAVITAIIAVLSRNPWVHGLVALPGGVSILVLGLGFWRAYGNWIDPFSGNGTAIIILQVILFLPLAFRMIWPIAQHAQVSALEEALTLGATPMRAFLEVEWPRWKGPLANAITLVFAASLGEVAAVSFFYSDRLIPLPLLISRLANQYRFQEAHAVSALLFLVSVFVTGFIFFGRGFFERNHG